MRSYMFYCTILTAQLLILDYSGPSIMLHCQGTCDWDNVRQEQVRPLQSDRDNCI